ncbi:bifunctional UDP-sugar hydrolase/5'-nucleotidase UshA [Pseudoalteromonas tunicata]|jgi:5'-nucleotidase/UDP-sugar diphosphatase|uniref:bifunctional UDP-sugar hydrolase/5'-nucleotidase UshA n=1 Tax=Pseudoalteromonas tunicata TaxID=314281 RepID=UPI000323674A|nr:bifunctional UDP-sugar hydrolase/5'-nucleotidase UshA [Pseudoalteromonas tunicata]ATC96942.1 5'-nucleotidase / UDP-sugar diphosphatase [Pseudoalteromonas tunicata]AXT33071.1 bifunctional UDP-sugar hydrolase/5'-nucleotidase [Pseudoalteromonas tunicata]MDP4983946.1 bifunctional UDP-sugar hydrolase/5'-nucleotidase UshA [Pseudoalteromonas tunicata]
MHLSRLALITLFGISTLGGCSLISSNSHTSSSEVQHFTLLHTNDNHGRFWQNEKGEYGMAARKTLIDRLRAQAEAKNSTVLLLSGGDINTGVPESDMQFAEPDFKGMSLLGYDAMALGNHEFDNPLNILEKQQSWANFPFLSANILDAKTGKTVFQPYKIFNKKGLKIAVVGLTTTDTAKIGNPEYIGHLKFAEPVDVTNNLITELEATEQPDITIAVTHMGHYVDANFGINAPGDVTLARSLKPGLLDIIVGGHSQEPVCMNAVNVADTDFLPGDACKPDQQNGTWIVQAHEWGKYVGKAEFEYQNQQLRLVSYELIPVNMQRVEIDTSGKKTSQLAQAKITPDPSMLAFLQPFQAKGDAKLSVSIATLNGRLEGDRQFARFEQTNLGRLIASAQMERVQGDFGIISGGGIRSSIEGGEVSYKDILSVHPFKNRISYVDMKGEELVGYLSTVASFPPDSGAYCQFYGVELTLENGLAQNIKIQGKPIDKEKTYRFSINSYNAAGGDGYPTLKNHPGFVATDATDAEVLKEFFLKHNNINAADFNPNSEITIIK